MSNKALTHLKIGVQQLVVIQALEEQLAGTELNPNAQPFTPNPQVQLDPVEEFGVADIEEIPLGVS